MSNSGVKGGVDLADRVLTVLRTIPDFPVPGVMFRDITPLLAAPSLFGEVIDWMHATNANRNITHILAVESRGFLFGAPLALAMGASLVPVRKPGKLPYSTISESFTLEYRDDTLEVHVDAFGEGARCLVVDDVLATGGTAAAACRLAHKLGGEAVGVSVLLEIASLGGRDVIAPVEVAALVSI